MNLRNKLFFAVGLWLMSWSFGAAQLVNYKDATGTPIREKKYAEIKGSPYLNDQWISGNVIVASDQIQTNVPIRYNAYEDKIEFQQSGATFMYDNKTILGCDLYAVDPKTQKLRRYVIRNGFEGMTALGYGDTEFFIVSYQNKVAFISKLKANLTETTATYGDKSTSKIFVQSEKSFLIKEDGKVMSVKRSLGSIIKALGQETLKSFAKSEKLNVNEDGDLAKLLNEYEVQFLKETKLETGN